MRTLIARSLHLRLVSPATRQRGRLASLYASSVGRKFVMAMSGVAIVGFVIAHLFGTLKIFLGPEATDSYAAALRHLGRGLVPPDSVLWVLRIGLGAAFAVHLHAAFSLDRRNRSACGDRSQTAAEHIAARYAARTMLWSGIFVGVFVVFHLADLTWGVTNPHFAHADPYNNQISSFSNPVIVASYLAGVIALTIHLRHGLWSLFQSLGIDSAAVPHRTRRHAATAIAVGIGAGYAAIPLAVLTGILQHSR